MLTNLAKIFANRINEGAIVINEVPNLLNLRELVVQLTSQQDINAS